MATAMHAPSVSARKLNAREAAILVFVACLVPLLVHLYPWSGPRPLGAYVLPMFWATFVAAYFYGVTAALVAAVAGPAFNLLLTGLPAWKFLGVMGVELVVFGVVAAWAVPRVPRFWLIAPLAYLAAKSAISGVITLINGNVDSASILPFFTRSFTGTWPGLSILAVINLVLVMFYPKPGVRSQ